MKRTLFWVTVAFTLLAILGEATISQLIPFFVAMVVLYKAMDAKRKKYEATIATIGVIMFVVNLSIDPPSGLDLGYWLAFIIAAYTD